MHSSPVLRSPAAGENSSTTPLPRILQQGDVAQLLPCIDDVLDMFSRIQDASPSLPNNPFGLKATTTTTEFNLCQDSTIQLEDFLDAIATTPSKYIAIQCDGDGSNNNNSNKAPCRIVATEPPAPPPSQESPLLDQPTTNATTASDNGPSLLVVIGVATLLGMLSATLLIWLFTMRRAATRRRQQPKSPPTPPPRRSSASAIARQALAEQKQQRRAKQQGKGGGGGDIEESVVDVYTATDDDDDDEDDDTTAHSQESRHRLPTNESSVLSGLTATEDAAVRSRLSSNGDKDNWTTYHSENDYEEDQSTMAGYSYARGGQDEASITGYSISAAVDAGTVLVLPSSAVGFGGKERGPERGEDSVVSHYSQAAAAAAATATLPLVVQRTIKAPPGKLGVTLAVTSEGPKVRSVKVGSPVEDLLFAGDVVVGINDTNTRALSTPAIYKLLEQTNDMQRSITVLTIDDVTRKQPKNVHGRRQREQQRR